MFCSQELNGLHCWTENWDATRSQLSGCWLKCEKAQVSCFCHMPVAIDHQPCQRNWFNFFFIPLVLLVLKKGGDSFSILSSFLFYFILFFTINCDPPDGILRFMRTSIMYCPACATENSCPAWRPSGPLSSSWWSAPGSAPQWLPRSLLSAPGKVLSRPCWMQPTILTC